MKRHRKVGRGTGDRESLGTGDVLVVSGVGPCTRQEFDGRQARREIHRIRDGVGVRGVVDFAVTIIVDCSSGAGNGCCRAIGKSQDENVIGVRDG